MKRYETVYSFLKARHGLDLGHDTDSYAIHFLKPCSDQCDQSTTLFLLHYYFLEHDWQLIVEVKMVTSMIVGIVCFWPPALIFTGHAVLSSWMCRLFNTRNDRVGNHFDSTDVAFKAQSRRRFQQTSSL